MKHPKQIIAVFFLGLTILISFALPKVKYKSPDILSQLQIPMVTENWRGQDISNQINTDDLRYNFISRIFARAYQNKYGQRVTLLILDAGNFHNPKVCYGSSGYGPKDMPETEFKLPHHSVKATTVYFEKGYQSEIMFYWICINKKQVNWAGQKLMQLWYSLFNKQKVGLMARLQLPAQPETTTSAVETAQEFIAELSKSIPQSQQDYLFGR